MIRIQHMPPNTFSGVARYYENEHAGPFEDYGWACMLNWNPDCPDKDIWIHGMIGKTTFKSLRQLVYEINDLGFKRIRALRKEGHVLPKAKEQPDGSFIILVSDLLKKE